ncbi:MAG: DUF1508 domain-containing protein [Nitrososphaerota archaeon]
MAKFHVYKDEKGNYRWRLQSDNNKFVADSSLGYRSKYECIKAIKSIQKSITKAEISKATEEIII